MQTSHPTALIVIGGFAGSGKSTLSRRLSSELRIPRLGSDTIGRTIRGSRGIREGDVDAYWIAYELLFRLCEEFLQSGVSTILDLSMGWAFQWRELDAITARHPEVRVVPIVLRCPRELCLERISRRYRRDPAYYDPPELYTSDPKLLAIWEYLERLDRPGVSFVDAARPEDEADGEIRAIVAALLTGTAAAPGS